MIVTRVSVISVHVFFFFRGCYSQVFFFFHIPVVEIAALFLKYKQTIQVHQLQATSEKTNSETEDKSTRCYFVRLLECSIRGKVFIKESW